MAKHRRPSKPTRVRVQSAPSRPARTVRPGSRLSAPPARGNSASPSAGPQRRSTYFEAVALYELGLDALQRHEYSAAENRFNSVLRQFPEEKELHERVRLYLSICQRQTRVQQMSPQSVDERLYAATLAINGGNYDLALLHLRLVRDQDPDNDHALYMLAVAHAQRGEHAEAVAHLERAIALNRENRALAKSDPDLQPLHDDDSFRAALEAAPLARPDRRRPVKARTAR